MALRKFYGKGHEQYYLEWRWWLGTGSDAGAPRHCRAAQQQLLDWIACLQGAERFEPQL